MCNLIPKEPRYKCSNAVCGFKNKKSEFSDARNVEMRVKMGIVASDKECPKCQNLAYPIKFDLTDLTKDELLNYILTENGEISKEYKTKMIEELESRSFYEGMICAGATC